MSIKEWCCTCGAGLRHGDGSVLQNGSTVLTAEIGSRQTRGIKDVSREAIAVASEEGVVEQKQ
eukprot:IDg9912t1